MSLLIWIAFGSVACATHYVIFGDPVDFSSYLAAGIATIMSIVVQER